MSKKPMDRLDVERCRRQFPSLTRRVDGNPAVFLDGPAGTQVPQVVADAVSRYLLETNANSGGLFPTSLETEALVSTALGAACDFVGADDPELITYGPNMTTLTFALSRAMARTWGPGDEVIVTQLDHDANFTPWVLAARDAGATVHKIGLSPEDCSLDLDDFEARLSSRTRLVAFGAASNAVGTVNPVRQLVDLAHAAGALTFVDAVHSAPHRPIDVAGWDCDFVCCSSYKFFGPHAGILWGRRELLEELPAYKLRPATDRLPGRWLCGTENFECMAGTVAAIDYLADIGRSHGAGDVGRREALLAAYEVIDQHERSLANRLVERLAELPDVRVWGITDPDRFGERVSTFGLTYAGKSAETVCRHLAKQGIFAWHGNFYALPVTEALGLEPEGLVRIGLLHYNTTDEVDRLVAALGTL